MNIAIQRPFGYILNTFDMKILVTISIERAKYISSKFGMQHIIEND